MRLLLPSNLPEAKSATGTPEFRNLKLRVKFGNATLPVPEQYEKNEYANLLSGSA